jgi:hypothetical protein
VEPFLIAVHPRWVFLGAFVPSWLKNLLDRDSFYGNI